eukprot:scaffold415927_cov17-Prasinocladus_malaysianus.AAC.1
MPPAAFPSTTAQHSSTASTYYKSDFTVCIWLAIVVPQPTTSCFMLGSRRGNTSNLNNLRPQPSQDSAKRRDDGFNSTDTVPQR